jgi:hypothetical protein
VTSSTIIVAVPVLVRRNGVPTAGTAKVTIVQNTAGRASKTVAYNHLHTADLPKTGLPAGSVTSQFLAAEQYGLNTLTQAYRTIDTAVPGTINANFPNPTGWTIFQVIQEVQQQLTTAQQQVNEVVSGRDRRIEIGVRDSHRVSMTRKSLALSDRILAAIAGASVATRARAAPDASLLAPIINYVQSNPVGALGTALMGIGAVGAVVAGANPFTAAIAVGGVVIAAELGLSMAYGNTVISQLWGTVQNYYDAITHSSWANSATQNFNNDFLDSFSRSTSPGGSDGFQAPPVMPWTPENFNGPVSATNLSINQRLDQLAQNLGLPPYSGQTPTPPPPPTPPPTPPPPNPPPPPPPPTPTPSGVSGTWTGSYTFALTYPDLDPTTPPSDQGSMTVTLSNNPSDRGGPLASFLYGTVTLDGLILPTGGLNEAFGSGTIQAGYVFDTVTPEKIEGIFAPNADPNNADVSLSFEATVTGSTITGTFSTGDGSGTFTLTKSS